VYKEFGKKERTWIVWVMCERFTELNKKKLRKVERIFYL